MALIGLLFNKKSFKNKLGYEASNGDLVGAISIDATLSETHTYKSSVTKNEIEQDVDGLNSVNDNIVHEPISIQLTGIISEAPINFENLAQNVGLGAIANISTGVSAIGGILSSELLSKDTNDRITSNFENLILLRNNKSPLTIITGLKKYSDMIITSIVFTKDNKIGRSLKFTISLMKVLIVQSETKLISKSRIKKDAQASGTDKKNLGKQGTETPTTEESTRGASILSKISGVGA